MDIPSPFPLCIPLSAVDEKVDRVAVIVHWRPSTTWPQHELIIVLNIGHPTVEPRGQLIPFLLEQRANQLIALVNHIVLAVGARHMDLIHVLYKVTNIHVAFCFAKHGRVRNLANKRVPFAVLFK